MYLAEANPLIPSPVELIFGLIAFFVVFGILAVWRFARR